MESFSIYNHLKLGIVHFKAFPEVVRGEGPVVETLRIIVEDDFWTAVEVGMVKDIKQRNEVRKLLEVSHMEVCYATQPKVLTNKLNLNSLDTKERKQAVSAVKGCVDEAFDMGATWMRFISGKDPGDKDREDAKKALIESLSEIMEYADEQGDLGFTLKIFDRDMDKCALIGHFADAADVAEELCSRYNNFGLLSDLSHFGLLREKPEDALPLVRKYPLHFHLGNCVVKDKRHPAYGDLQPRFGIPGGEVDTEEVRRYFQLLKNLEMIGPKIKPVCSVEVRPLLAEEYPEVIIANAKRVIREAWAGVQ